MVTRTIFGPLALTLNTLNSNIFRTNPTLFVMLLSARFSPFFHVLLKLKSKKKKLNLQIKWFSENWLLFVAAFNLHTQPAGSFLHPFHSSTCRCLTVLWEEATTSSIFHLISPLFLLCGLIVVFLNDIHHLSVSLPRLFHYNANQSQKQWIKSTF